MKSEFMSHDVPSLILKLGGIWQMIVNNENICITNIQTNHVLCFEIYRTSIHSYTVKKGFTEIYGPKQHRKIFHSESFLYEYLLTVGSLVLPRASQEFHNAIVPKECSIFKMMRAISTTYWNVQGSSSDKYTFRHIIGDELAPEHKRQAVTISLDMKSGWFIITSSEKNTEKTYFRLPKKQFKILQKGNSFKNYTTIRRSTHEDRIYAGVARLYTLMVHSFKPWFVNNPQFYPTR